MSYSHLGLHTQGQDSLSRLGSSSQAQDSLARISSMTNSISPPQTSSHGSLSPGQSLHHKLVEPTLLMLLLVSDNSSPQMRKRRLGKERVESTSSAP